jgi:hypothetical protein
MKTASMIHFSFASCPIGPQGQRVALNFLQFDTECSWDFVYVFDGESYTSPRLGAFSGSDRYKRQILSSNSSVRTCS